jgi:hypothetical protein
MAGKRVRDTISPREKSESRIATAKEFRGFRKREMRLAPAPHTDLSSMQVPELPEWVAWHERKGRDTLKAILRDMTSIFLNFEPSVE